MPGQAFIDGRYDAASGARFDCISPIDGRVLAARRLRCTVERAVLAARRAFDAGTGRRPARRIASACCWRWPLVEKHADELALLETLDGRSRCATHAVSTCPAWCAAWPGPPKRWTVYWEIAPTGPSWGWSRASVVAAVVPWNFRC